VYAEDVAVITDSPNTLPEAPFDWVPRMDVTVGRNRFALKLAFLLGFSALLFAWQLGNSSVVSEEFRWAEIGREMRDTGNYFHPTINGQIYYDKPVGSYWFIVAASHENPTPRLVVESKQSGGR